MINERERDDLAKIIWDYLQMHQPLVKADAVFVLGSLDDRVASYAADIFLKGYGEWFIVSGGVSHKNDLLATQWKEETEAAHFAAIAKERGVPEEKILLEDQSTNTGENIQFVSKLLKKRGIHVTSLLLVQKPYMERRAFATFRKQWPDPTTAMTITSPPIPFDEYCNETQPKEKILHIMVGDLQRIKEYPRRGFQIEQDIPGEVWSAYEKLVAAGFTHHLLASETH